MSIWEGVSIPVYGVAGEYASGKTLAILSIDPEHTLLFDVELSAASYNLPLAKRIDVPAELLKIHKAGYKPIDMWLWFLDQLRKIEPGKYTVIAVDPISDIEQGLCDWVNANPAYFGRSADQYKKSGGIFWGDVKAYWKMVLADLAVRCETFAYTVHMRDQFSGASPTGKREPKGKDTLMELASLALLLERKSDAKGEVPEKPAGIVIKSRLAHTKWENGELKVLPILPPRLPIATPTAIREFIKRPADYNKLTKGQRLEVVVQTEQEKIAAQTILADKMLEIEKTKSANMEKAEQATLRAAKALEEKLLKTTPAPDRTAEAAERKEEQAKARAEDAKEEIKATVAQPTNGEAEDPFKEFKETLTKISQIAKTLNLTQGQLDAILAKRGVEHWESLSLLQAEEIRSKLYNKLLVADMEKEAAGKE